MVAVGAFGGIGGRADLAYGNSRMQSSAAVATHRRSARSARCCCLSSSSLKALSSCAESAALAADSSARLHDSSSCSALGRCLRKVTHQIRPRDDAHEPAMVDDGEPVDAQLEHQRRCVGDRAVG